MVALLTPADVAELLGVRDLRTVRRELARLGCPVVLISRSYRVRPDDLDAAIAAAARCESIDSPGHVVRRPAPARTGTFVAGSWRALTDGEVGSADGR